MRKSLILLLVSVICMSAMPGLSMKCLAQEAKSTKVSFTKEEQEVIDLSRAKWQWMADKEADKLADLFHENAIFVHMGGAWGKKQEVDIIRGGMIHYKKAEIFEESVRFAGDNTAIVLGKIKLIAILGGKHEAVNPFLVTEVYVKEGNRWKLASLSFTKSMERNENTK